MGMFTDNEEIIRLGVNVLLLSIVLETGRTINIVLVNSLRAAGDAKYPLWIGMGSMVAMSLPLGYFFVFQLDLGFAGIWLAIAADEWCAHLLCFSAGEAEHGRSMRWSSGSIKERAAALQS